MHGRKNEHVYSFQIRRPTREQLCILEYRTHYIQSSDSDIHAKFTDSPNAVVGKLAVVRYAHLSYSNAHLSFSNALLASRPARQQLCISRVVQLANCAFE